MQLGALNRVANPQTALGRDALSRAPPVGTKLAYAPRVECPRRYQARDPRAAVLHPLVSEWWPALRSERTESGVTIPAFVERAFEGFLACGVPEAGFVRLRCPDCHVERALAFSCKHRGLCPSFGARRMHDVTSHLMERVFPEVPIRQYVLSPPSELVGLLAAREDVLATMTRVFVQAIFRGQRERLGASVQSGAVVFVQRFTKTLSVYPHLHVLALDGGYTEGEDGAVEFHGDPGPSAEAREVLEDEVETRLSGWLGRRGYLDATPEPRPDDGWWLSGARASLAADRGGCGVGSR